MAAAKKAATKGWRVVAPLVQASVGSRADQFFYGDVLPGGVSEESLEHLKSLGYVEEIDAPAESDDSN